MLRFQVTEGGQDPLPAIDVDATSVVIGSAVDAAVRLPAHAAREHHVRIVATGRDARWTALEDLRLVPTEVTAIGARSAGDRVHGGDDSIGLRRAGDSGDVHSGVTFQLGEYRVHVAPAPPGTSASPPQRTESLARELVRGLLGDAAAPTLEVERGPVAGIQRALPPPDATIVIGRGEDAGWIILDEDLSRAHAEIRRTWDGITIRDLDSKNGTLVDGARIASRTTLRDGALIELGKVALRFRDPAERHLRGESTAVATPRAARLATPRPAAPRARVPTLPRGNWPFLIATAIAAVALAALVWILAT